MSNPFRRAQALPPPKGDVVADEPVARKQSPRPAKGQHLTSSLVATGPKPVKKKRVTIQTPPHSPEELQRRFSQGAISPPPPIAALDYDAMQSTMAFAPNKTQGHYGPQNEHAAPPAHPAPAAVKAPYNPFARTLATREAAFGVQRPREQQSGAVTAADSGGGRAGDGRTAMDVDMFKNILLNGDAPPAITESRLSQDATRDQDLDTSTDSASEASSDADDSGFANAIDADTRPNSVPPSAVPPRRPQTVSFADFGGPHPSDSPPASEHAPSDTTQPFAVLRGSAGTSSPVTSSSQRSLPEQDIRDTRQEKLGTAAVDEGRKRAPPPPPTSRRQLQSGRARSVSNTTDDSLPDDVQSATRPTGKPAAPPPPPSRRPRQASQSSSPAVSTPLEMPLPSPLDLKIAPAPPPPPRRSNMAAPSSSRPASIASQVGVSRGDAPPLPPAQAAAPPAPRSRRAPAGQRGSTDSGAAPSTAARRRRSSVISYESGRSASISSVQPNTPPLTHHDVPPASTDTSSGADILADMSAFQAELDALREAAARRG